MDVPVVVELRYEVGRIIGDGNFAVVREGVDRCILSLSVAPMTLMLT